MAIADHAGWVTTHAGLFQVDLVTNEAVNVLPRDYLFRVSSGFGSIWITTGSDGHILRFDPQSMTVTAEIDVRAGPVTGVTMSTDAVWVSANSDLVRIDPATNDVTARVGSETFGDIGSGGAGLWVVVGANDDGQVWQIDPGTGGVMRQISLANPSFWNEVVVGDEAVWVTSSPTVHRDGRALVHLYRIDPSTGDIAADIPLGIGPSGLAPDEGAASYSALVPDDENVWVLVGFDGPLVEIGGGNVGVTETIDRIEGGGSDAGPGMAIGADSILITASNAILRVRLEA